MVTKSGGVVRYSSSSPFSGKRGQVTVFIIIGIVILFAFAGIMYFTQTFTKDSIDAAGDPILSSVPQEFQTVNSFTENCIFQSGKKGLLVLGQQGGYIHPEVVGKYSPSNPVESDGINLQPLNVPYWHYNVLPTESNEVQFSSLKPELYYRNDNQLSIEAQLSRYVEENLDSCLNDYKAFASQGFDFGFEPSLRKVEVTIGDETVNFLMTMPLVVSNPNAEHTIEQFYVKIPLKLKHLYGVAEDIAGAEKNFTFVENMAAELIQIYGHADIDKLPPTDATTFEDISYLQWDSDLVKGKFEQALVTNVPMLRYMNSNNFHRYEYPVTDLSAVYQRTYDNMIIPLENGEGLDINFDYFGWNTHLDINEGEDSIKPNSFFLKSPLPLIPFSFSMQQYYNTYDVAFPVMVSVNDPSAFGGEGYSFVFAMEANLLNNVAAEENDESMPEAIIERSETMLCDEDKRNSDIIKTVVLDSFSKEPVELVQIGFSVPEQDTCMMGLTNNHGELSTNYPAVYGGVVEVIKTDYLTNYYPVDTYEYIEQPGIVGYAVADFPEEVIEMHKFKEVAVSVKKKEISKCVKPSICSYTVSPISLLAVPYKDISCELGNEKCFYNSGDSLFDSGVGEEVYNTTANHSLSRQHHYYLTNGRRALSEKERVMINLERVADLNPNVVSDDFSVAITLVGEEVSAVNLVPGIYSMSSTVIYEDVITIPTDSRCTTYNVLGWEEDKCFNINGMEAESYLTGTVELNTPETYIEITPEQLYTAEEIEFTVLNYDLAALPETFESYNKQCGSFLYCLPGVGCLFEACDKKDINLNTLVIEDLTVMGEMDEISRMAHVRPQLELMYK
jgi:hypothetical protein